MLSAANSNVPPAFQWRAEGFDPAAYDGAHALAPISLGLAVPALALVYAVPGMAAYWALLIGLYLLVIFIVTAVIFVRSIMRSDEVAEVQVDARAKTIAVTRRGSFGNTTDFIAFSRVADAYFHIRYDDDGYKIVEPRLHLKSSEDIIVPGEVTAAELQALRMLLAGG